MLMIICVDLEKKRREKDVEKMAIILDDWHSYGGICGLE